MIKKDNLIILDLVDTKLDFQVLDIKLRDTITPNDLKYIKFPQTDSLKGLIISGRIPLWLCSYIHSIYRNKIWVAQYDLRFGALITQCKNKDLMLKKIRRDKIEKYISSGKKEALVIAFLGPPHSGKTVFLFSLFKKLLKENYDYFNREAFIIKGCPDGEGIWSSEIPQLLVTKVRYKNKFTKRFIDEVIRQIKFASKIKSILFVDCGGKIDDANSKILSNCNAAIIVSNDNEKTEEWKTAYINNKLKLIAEIKSTLTSQIDSRVDNKSDGCLYMTISGLDRENKNVIIPKDIVDFFKMNNRG
jgi:CRISPR-associated protein Csx3